MRIVRFAVALLGCLGIAGAIGGCSGQPTGAPHLPTIENPLDLSKYESDPCRLATAADLAQYHLISPGGVMSSSQDAVCAWAPAVPTLPSYRVEINRSTGGLPGLYALRSHLAVFVPMAVSEYPAVQTAVTTEALKQGECDIDIAVANDTLLDVNVQVPATDTLDHSAPCDDAEMFAGTVIATAEAGSP